MLTIGQVTGRIAFAGEEMERKTFVIGTIAAILSGIVLLALGVMAGHSWPQSRVLILNPAEANANAASVTQVENTVTIQGQSAVKAKPDIARLFMGITACDSDAAKANQEINDKLAVSIERLKSAGAPKEDIVPSEFSMYPRYSNYNEGTITGFCATNRLVVTTDNLQDVSRLLDTAIEAGVTNVYGVVFTVKDTSPVRQEAIRLAYADAEQQVRQLSSLLGQRARHVIKANVQINDNLTGYIAGYTGGGGAVESQEGTLNVNVTLVYALSKE
jgi:uncharacterized protein YggE